MLLNLMHTGTKLSYPWTYQWRRGVSWWSLSSSPDKGWGGAEAAGPSPLGVTRSGKHRSSPGTGRSCRCVHGYRDDVLLYCVSEQFPLWAWTWREAQGVRTEAINDVGGMICGYNSPVWFHVYFFVCFLLYPQAAEAFIIHQPIKILSPRIAKDL